MTTVVPINKARKHLGELIQEAHYKGKPFILTRNNKPMATILGTDEFSQMLEIIEKHDYALADTLAIMYSPEIREGLKQGDKDIADGKVLPFDKSLIQDK
jgi:prevent-host-death family protein